MCAPKQSRLLLVLCSTVVTATILGSGCSPMAGCNGPGFPEPPENQPPVADDQSVFVPFETPTTIVLTATDPDDRPSPLTISIVTEPLHGELSGTAPNLTYSPNLAFSGADSFTFQASDGQSDSAPGTVSLAVAGPGNQAPVADSQSVTVENSARTLITLTATDPDGGPQPLRFAIVDPPEHGSLVGTPPNVEYQPQSIYYSGTDRFTFQANDGAADSKVGLASLVVQPSDAGSIVGWGRQDLVVRACGLTDLVAIAAGDEHSLGLKSDGSIVAWGNNLHGQCNLPAPNTDFVALAGGGLHSLGLKVDGSIVAWGHPWFGQCDVPDPNTDFVAVGAGLYHSLGLKADGSIVAWGNNEFGQCDVPAPNTGFVAIAAGEHYSLGLKADGSIVVWNASVAGSLPAPNHGFVALAGGGSHSLGLKRE